MNKAFWNCRTLHAQCFSTFGSVEVVRRTIERRFSKLAFKEEMPVPAGSSTGLLRENHLPESNPLTDL